MSEAQTRRSDVGPVVEPARVGRDWLAIVVGLAAALAVIGLYSIAVWAVVMIVQAL
jgi:hypothetical protein